MTRIRRLAAVLAGLAGALLAFAAAAPAALAAPANAPPGRHPPPPGQAASTAGFGGMPGWQITLLSAVTVLTAPAVAVLWDRARPARRPGHPCRLGNARTWLTRVTFRPAASGRNHALQRSRSWTAG